MSILARVLRVLLALVILAALVHNAVTSARDGLLAQNISFFTNQSNLALVVLIGAWMALGSRRSAWFDDVRGAVTFYLAMTGIIYALLVAPLDELLRWDIGWTGIVLHRLAPLAALADWLLTPRIHRPRWARVPLWQIYPIIFLVLTWIRGGITGWYPYAFLDPTASSWGQVLVTTAVVLVAFLSIAVVIHLVQGRLRSPASEPRTTDTPQGYMIASTDTPSRYP
ncbi:MULTISPECIES: Pr6Pr family membrane protein [unclassified Brachybacterium]|uniref:Pr6Pr family membrane protein n=1 Tax=unclassified Brachybacterium TaxID=2623841 RepID=UPI0018EADD39|nr:MULTISPECIES: Pr6Pr family membrane protein [unclassified Brachybacterium]